MPAFPEFEYNFHGTTGTVNLSPDAVASVEEHAPDQYGCRATIRTRLGRTYPVVGLTREQVVAKLCLEQAPEAEGEWRGTGKMREWVRYSPTAAAPPTEASVPWMPGEPTDRSFEYEARPIGGKTGKLYYFRASSDSGWDAFTATTSGALFPDGWPDGWECRQLPLGCTWWSVEAGWAYAPSHPEVVAKSEAGVHLGPSDSLVAVGRWTERDNTTLRHLVLELLQDPMLPGAEYHRGIGPSIEPLRELLGLKGKVEWSREEGTGKLLLRDEGVVRGVVWLTGGGWCCSGWQEYAVSVENQAAGITKITEWGEDEGVVVPPVPDHLLSPGPGLERPGGE